MKSKFILNGGLLALLLVSCAPKEQPAKEVQQPAVENLPVTTPSNVEDYRSIEQFRLDALNEDLKGKTFTDDAEIMKLYAAKDINATNADYTYDVSTNVIDENRKEVTLISDNFQDDATKALKVVMTLEKVDNDWKVTQIKESYKCQVGRGQQDWSATLCN